MKRANKRISGLAGKRTHGFNPSTRPHAHSLAIGGLLIAALFFLIPVAASALEMSQVNNRSIFKAPLIWRADGVGNASFGNALLSGASLAQDGSVVSAGSGGICELDNPFVAEGQIIRLSATWVFTGKVTLEVSLTGNPKDYVRVTNGVPMEFQKSVTGSRIQWRATLAPQSTLSQVRIVYTDLSGVVGSFGNELLSGFKARKQTDVNGSQAGELFQYQIPVKVGESEKSPDLCDVKLNGGILSDFKDIRFTLADGETVVPHFLESVSGPKPDRLATFWIKVPEIPAEGLFLYVYFGCAAAEDISSGEKVFDFYEDFAGPALDSKKWKLTLGDKTGKAYVQDSRLVLEKAKLTTAQYLFTDGMLEYQARVLGSGAMAGILRQTASGDNDLVAYASTLSGSEHAIAKSGDVEINDAKPVLPEVFYVYRIQCDPKGDLSFKRYNENGEGDPEAQVHYVSGMSQASPVGLSSSNQEHSVECSWMRTRRSVDPAPKIDPEKTAAGLLEPVDLPEFYDVSTAPDGGLVTKPEAREGHYISRPIAPAFAVRILKPEWLTKDPEASPSEESGTAGTVSVSISTNEGAAYTPGWENGVTRYVSKKEFESSGQMPLRWKADIGAPGAEALAGKQEAAAGSSLKKFSLEYYPGTIRVVRPSGNETLVSGTPYIIFWDAPGFGPKYPVEISYSTEKGEAWKIIASKTDNTGDLSWAFPGEATRTAFVKVADYFDKTIFGVSENAFEVRASSGEAEGETVAATGTSSAPEESAVPAVPAGPGTRNYLLSGKGAWEQPKAWSGSKVPDLASDVNITTNVTLYADGPVSFRRLVIGDGTGKADSTVVLKAGIQAGSGEILIRKGGKLVQATSLAQAITGDLIIEDEGVLTHKENKSEKQYQLNLTARNIILKPGAMVSARAKGYSGGDERQAGQGRSGGKFQTKAAGGGRHNYDTVRMPVELGSGGAGSGAAKGGAGGGVIKLVALKEFSLSGIVNADGESGVMAAGNAKDAAGGAGGSIFLEAHQFSGKGAKITATGGSGQKTGGAGGGGRIHIKAVKGVISGTINANGGSGQDTEAGSVIVE